MKQEDYPWLCCASEEASRSAQKWHFRLLRAQLIVFFVVTLFNGVTKVVPFCAQKPISVAIAIVLFIGIIFTYIAQVRKFDKIWFDARAIAESVKTIAWRYMMRGNPFDAEMTNPEKAFLAELTEIQNSRPSVQPYLGGQSPEIKPITKYMQEMRATEFSSRKAAYIEHRIRDQKTWYGSKAIWNHQRGNAWYVAVLASQAIALAWAIVAAAYGPFPINFAAFLMTAAASFTAWAQAKRHEDLNNSYSIAAQELLNIELLAEQVGNDSEFRDIVDQAEEAISREHTMWCAKRNISITSATKKGK
jgi:hypothetical protein